MTTRTWLACVLALVAVVGVFTGEAVEELHVLALAGLVLAVAGRP